MSRIAMSPEPIERLATEAERSVNLSSPGWRFVNTEVLASLVAEECARFAERSGSAEHCAALIRGAFPAKRDAR